MNSPNPSGGVPISNKLILLLLSGIFICLVLLVIRAFDRPSTVFSNEAASISSTPEAEPVQLPEQVTVIESRPSSHRPTSTTTRTQVIALTPRLSPKPTPRNGTGGEAIPDQNAGTVELPAAAGQRANASRNPNHNIRAVGNPGETSSSIVGSITLVGQPRSEIPIDFGPQCGKFAPPATTRHYVVGPNGKLANVFVYVVDATRTAVTSPGPLLDQVGCMYEPYVMGVGVNQPFGIRNSDPELHNIHATPQLNKEFNIAHRAGSPVILRSFAQPEVLVRLKCDLHPWMFAYVGVVDHPWFAISDSDGTYQIPQGIPAGRYRLSAVHLKAGIQTQDIIVKSGQPTVVNFTFAVPGNATPQTTQVPYATR